MEELRVSPSELKMLIDGVEQVEKNTDIYCELILQMFMRQSANN